MHLTQVLKENILKLAHKAKPTVCSLHKIKLNKTVEKAEKQRIEQR